MKPHIYTYSGLVFYFNNPTEETIDIVDIAHALSNICRWTGHTKTFYSVAQHCVMCSLEGEYPLRKLLHDSAEAYIGDINKPLKTLLGCDFDEMENKITDVIYQRFGMGPMSLDEYTEVKRVDRNMAVSEAQALLDRDNVWMYEGSQAIKGLVIQPWSPETAEQIFLQRFQDLRRKQ